MNFIDGDRLKLSVEEIDLQMQNTSICAKVVFIDLRNHRNLKKPLLYKKLMVYSKLDVYQRENLEFLGPLIVVWKLSVNQVGTFI